MTRIILALFLPFSAPLEASTVASGFVILSGGGGRSTGIWAIDTQSYSISGRLEASADCGEFAFECHTGDTVNFGISIASPFVGVFGRETFAGPGTSIQLLPENILLTDSVVYTAPFYFHGELEVIDLLSRVCVICDSVDGRGLATFSFQRSGHSPGGLFIETMEYRFLVPEPSSFFWS